MNSIITNKINFFILTIFKLEREINTPK